jgi:hypothetical protein
VLGLSAVDVIGVLRRDERALHDGAAPEPVLSYHGDVDALDQWNQARRPAQSTRTEASM